MFIFLAGFMPAFFISKIKYKIQKIEIENIKSFIIMSNRFCNFIFFISIFYI